MTISSRKRRLRAEAITRILAIAEPERARQEDRILAATMALESYRSAETVLLYRKAFPEEIETIPLWMDALAAGKRVVCPRVDRRIGGLVLHVARSLDDLRPGVLNIPEPAADAPTIDPEAVDWVLAPGLAFDENGRRLGRGAGHYDRLLPLVRPDVEVWAAAFDVQVGLALPVEPHDVPLTGVVTASRIVRGR